MVCVAEHKLIYLPLELVAVISLILKDAQTHTIT